MSIKLIAIDLDGTLLNENHQITPPVKQAIHLGFTSIIWLWLLTNRQLIRL